MIVHGLTANSTLTVGGPSWSASSGRRLSENPTPYYLEIVQPGWVHEIDVLLHSFAFDSSRPSGGSFLILLSCTTSSGKCPINMPKWKLSRYTEARWLSIAVWRRLYDGWMETCCGFIVAYNFDRIGRIQKNKLLCLSLGYIYRTNKKMKGCITSLYDFQVTKWNHGILNSILY